MLLINGSPKLKKSNSNYFLNLTSKKDSIIYLYKDNFSKIDLKNHDTIVFSFPLYVDSIPSKVTEFIEYLDNNNIDISNKKIYAICNCGFLEPIHNEIALKIIENFTFKRQALYKGHISVGAGEIIGKRKDNCIYKIMSISFVFKFLWFKHCIKKGRKINLSTTIHPMTKKVYIKLANKSWKKKMKLNKIS